VIIANPLGGCTALWQEVERPEFGLRSVRYFYCMMDHNGEIIVDKTEIKDWYVPIDNFRHMNVIFTANHLLWISKDTLLIVAWRVGGHWSQMERILLTPAGVISSNLLPIYEGVSHHGLLLADAKGEVMALAFKDGRKLEMMLVYPAFGELATIPLKVDNFGLADCPEDRLVLTFTSNDMLLLCGRMPWGSELVIEKGLWHTYRPDKIFSILLDLDSNVVSGPVVFDLIEYAFRKIPGIHLGGYYYKSSKPRISENEGAVIEDIDFSRLPNGDIILSVTGEDETGKLCVYQIKFTPEGEIEKPQRMDVVNPRPFPEDKILPVQKVTWARGAEVDLVLFGFDEAGNFYAYREKWDDTND
jgi:hypothetical protein